MASVWGQNGHKVHLRIKAVRRGIDFIFNLVNGKIKIDDEDNLFENHGSDAIQCFNDIACASGEPIKRMALMYNSRMHTQIHTLENVQTQVQRATHGQMETLRR